MKEEVIDCGDGVWVRIRPDMIEMFFEDPQVGKVNITQSKYVPSDPAALGHWYTQCMMVYLLLRDPPPKVLILGLGGGTLVHWYARCFPAVEVSAVEYSKAVIDAANTYFDLPKQATVHHGCAAEFLRSQSDGSWPMVIVDLFDEKGLPKIINAEFLKNVKRVLTEDGIAIYNVLFDRQRVYAYLNPQYRGALLSISGYANQVMTCFNKPQGCPKLADLRERIGLLNRVKVDGDRLYKRLVESNITANERLDV